MTDQEANLSATGTASMLPLAKVLKGTVLSREAMDGLIAGWVGDNPGYKLVSTTFRWPPETDRWVVWGTFVRRDYA